MRGNRWSSALPPTVPARTGELRLAGGADRRRRAGRFRVLWAGLARDAVMLAGHGGVTAGRRRPGPGEVRPCRGTVKAPGRRQAHGVVSEIAELLEIAPIAGDGAPPRQRADTVQVVPE